MLSWLLITRHMKWLTLNYGHTLLINLLGNKEAEQLLSDVYKVVAIVTHHCLTILVIILETPEAFNIL